MSIKDEYLAKFPPGHVYEAAAELARDLMRGDPATLKQGYTMGNALIAAAHTFELGVEDTAVVVDQLTDDQELPLVIVDITGGVEQWTITVPGFGNPEVRIFDFDDEMDLDDIQFTLARWIEVINNFGHRIPEETLANMVETKEELQVRSQQIVDEMRAAQEADESTSKRERAAALLSDAEINGILDAHNAL